MFGASSGIGFTSPCDFQGKIFEYKHNYFPLWLTPTYGAFVIINWKLRAEKIQSIFFCQGWCAVLLTSCIMWPSRKDRWLHSSLRSSCQSIILISAGWLDVTRITPVLNLSPDFLIPASVVHAWMNSSISPLRDRPRWKLQGVTLIGEADNFLFLEVLPLFFPRLNSHIVQVNFFGWKLKFLNFLFFLFFFFLRSL